MTKQDDNTKLETLPTIDLAHVTGGTGFWGTVWEGAKTVAHDAAAPIYNLGYRMGSSCGEV